ncbi:putative membrane protein [Wickerhamomyces ciferrii]|uniref:Probable metalloreductase AIM14 n=1 Tax=Wickerhamomyces ciferrii (strain ATCC 14091 / BCRC 22168 / CBS 111 / JCM 3599 / NBRC 0793 / NRRL Y-1031 F-60-10) TaxID=1206466 RepID=K0KWH8_WICCF|nr:uncharacterized protein BN7_5935 [Wickerhamomyces ciferrii]CCH46342.1 putative membrane protein [Wickerhamomyces ciferrii]
MIIEEGQRNAYVDLIKRHGSTHFANVPIGHFLFFLTIINVIGIYSFQKFYLHKWSRSGRSTTSRALVSTPEWWKLIIWNIIIIGLSFYKFKLSLLSVFIKRLGRFAYLLLPLDIFFAFKPNPLPNIYYLEYVFLHKWLSRVIVLLSVVHGIMFTVKWAVEHEFFKFFRLLNFLGVIAVIGWLMITIISLKPIRHRFYKAFFTTHLILAWISPFLLQFHARPGVTFYSFIIVILFIAQVITKIWKSKDEKLDIETSKGSDLIIIKFPNSFGDYLPSSHIRISEFQKINPLTYLLPTHPFTIASSPTDSTIKLIVKKTNFEIKPRFDYSISGPFPSLHSNFFKTAENVVLVAGGSGISYALGIYQNLQINNFTRVHLIWVLRNKADLWILNHFNVKKIDIFITSDISKTDADNEEGDNLLQLNDDDVDIDTDTDFDIELEDFGNDPFADFNSIGRSQRRDQLQKTIKYGRPNLRNYTNYIDQYVKANNWVISCGTKSLNNDCSKWAKFLEVKHHSEVYEL